MDITDDILRVSCLFIYSLTVLQDFYTLYGGGLLHTSSEHLQPTDPRRQVALKLSPLCPRADHLQRQENLSIDHPNRGFYLLCLKVYKYTLL